MTGLVHPSDDELRGWLDDRLSDEALEELERHLEACDECARRIERLEGGLDPLVQRLRAAGCEDALSTDRPAAHAWDTVGDASVAAASDSSGAANAPPGERWQVETLLGEGGIGEVWLARDVLLGSPVALKRLRPRTAQLKAVQERFLREAKVTARLNHPGIPYVLDLADRGPDSYYVMTLVEGRTLTEMIAEAHRQRRECDEAAEGRFFALLQYLACVAKTIAFAHLKGILHRDLKSENVMVGTYGQVTVVDWGLAKSLDEQEDVTVSPETEADFRQLVALTAKGARATRPGERLGTPAFMAPEQARGELAAIDQRTDIYALAAILYEILTGQPPFSHRSVETVLQLVQTELPERPSRHWPDAPARLEELCLQGLAKNPADRPQSADEFVAALEGWMAHESSRREAQVARRRLFDLSQDGMLVLDYELRIIWASAAWLGHLGVEPEDLVGKKPIEFCHPDDLDADLKMVSQLQAGKSVSGFELRMRCKDGGYKWFSWTASPVPDEARICAVGRNIDDLRRQNQRLRGLLETMPGAVVVVDRTGRIVLASYDAEALLGYGHGELDGQPISTIVAEGSREAHRGVIERLALNPSAAVSLERLEFQGRRKDGSEFSADLRHSVLATDYELLITCAICPGGHTTATGENN